jgi:PKHD-type hydroxylase
MILNYYTEKNYYNQIEVKNLNKQLINLIVAGYDNAAAGVNKTCTVDAVLWKDAKTYLNRIEDYLHHINISKFGFEIYPYTDYDTVNINTYSASFEGEYGWHNDFILGERIYDNKLTFVMNISEEEYTGGEFQFFLNEPVTIDDRPGSIIIFPSWTQHRVLPVKSGERKSLSIWIKGPKFT